MTARLITSLAILFTLSMTTGCTGWNRHQTVDSARVDTLSHPVSKRFTATNTSHHLYVLTLGPKSAFTTESERNALWAALRGENPTVVDLLGPIDQIPMNYRIEYVFNHTTPDSREAELKRLTPWAKRLRKSAQDRVANAQTLLLVKGALNRLPNAQETRLTLAALVFVAERYDGVIFDLLNRQALTPAEVRARLDHPNGLKPQVRLMGAIVDGQAGIRSMGLPKYGLFDVFLATAEPRQDSKHLGAVVDALLKGREMPDSVELKPCKSTRLDYGCYRVHRL